MHKRIEAMKLAYSDVHRYDADPRTYDVPVAAAALERVCAQARRADRSATKPIATCPPGQPVGSDTTYLTVVDKDGNMASWIQSVYADFGSGVTVEGMGFMLQNRGAGFTLDPASSQRSRRRQAPLPHHHSRHSWSAAMCTSASASWAAPNQPLAHAQFVSNVVDYGMNLQAALEAPRFTKQTSHWLRCVDRRSRARGDSAAAFRARPSRFAIRREYTQEMGRGQAILHDSKTGTNYAASDPRADGAAIPEPIK